MQGKTVNFLREHINDLKNNINKDLKSAIKILSAVMFVCALSFPVSAGAAEYVIPSGKAVGVKIYTDGLLVVGMNAVNGGVSPAEKSGVKVGDRIISANGTNLETCEQLAGIVNASPNGVTLSLRRKNDTEELFAVPEAQEGGAYKLGIWVRDSTAGIGTMTYYNPRTNTFAALGHGICDTDTGNILTVESGNILNCRIMSVKKGERGSAGELCGSFEGSSIGTIELNAQNGIFGKYTVPESGDAVPIADFERISEGGAYILADVGGGVKPYSVRITKVSNNRSTKSITLRVTDEKLISITGGIVQGMSGAPIIQNGMLVGAVTHVFVNDPERGYGVAAAYMAETMQ